MKNKNSDEKNLFSAEELSPKVVALYYAVSALMIDGSDLNEIKVADITQKAGIGKGTAYEYFHNKDELICHAILYHIDRICTQIDRKLDDDRDFLSGIHEILDSMDREIEGQDCFIRFVHLLSDASGTGRTLKTLATQNKEQLVLPERLVHKLVTIGLTSGEINKELPVEYICFTLASKILCYIMFISSNRQSGAPQTAQMRELLCAGLLKELGPS